MLRPRNRGPAALAASVLAALLAAATATGATVPAAPAAARQAHPCPLDMDDYGSTIQWGLACVDYFATHGGTGGTGDGPRECALVPNPWGIPIVCVHEVYGWWSNTIGCYLRPVRPQPGADDPVWDGHNPADGMIHRLTCPWLEGVDGRPYWEWTIDRFFPARTGMAGQVVQRALARLRLTGAEIGIAPDPDGTGLVGLPVWLWTEVNARTWSPAPVRLTAAGWTVRVDAAVDRIVWDMGNGDTVVCDRPGTPYRDRYGAAPSPDCGYPGYARPSRTRPGGVYQITATTHWLVRWRFQGTGVSGVERTVRRSSTQVRIHELQVVIS